MLIHPRPLFQASEPVFDSHRGRRRLHLKRNPLVRRQIYHAVLHLELTSIFFNQRAVPRTYLQTPCT